MVLSDVSIKRPVFATVISLMLTVLGLFAAMRMPIREYPRIDPPIIQIVTTYTGASAPVVDSQITEILEAAVAGQTPLTATDHLGVVHRLWPVNDVRVIGDVAAMMEPRPLFIADGHHRYETACNYRDWLAEQGPLDANHPANFVLTQCVSMNDPGLLVLPTHRLFRGLKPLKADLLQSRLGRVFARARLPKEPTGRRRCGKIWRSPGSRGSSLFIRLRMTPGRMRRLPSRARRGWRRSPASRARIGGRWVFRSCTGW